MRVNLVKVTGHASHVETKTLVIEGRSKGVRKSEADRLHQVDAKAIHEFLRDNLPSGTLDRLAVRLASIAIDKLISSGWIDEFPEANEVREALKDYVNHLDGR